MHMRLSRFLNTEYGSTQRGLIPKRESRFSAAMFRFQARWLSQFGATMLEHFGDLNSDGWMDDESLAGKLGMSRCHLEPFRVPSNSTSSRGQLIAFIKLVRRKKKRAPLAF